MAFLEKLKRIGRKTETKAEPKEKSTPKAPKVKKAVSSVKKQTKAAWVYNIIMEPHLSEKAAFLGEKGGYVFRVSSGANKVEIKKAIEELYGVKVEKVRTVHIAAKKRRVGRHQGWKKGAKKGGKKAIIFLKEGEKIVSA